jgi:hypothetical protein
MMLVPGCGPGTVEMEGGVRVFAKNEARTVTIHPASEADGIERNLERLLDDLAHIRRYRRRLEPPEPGSPQADYEDYAGRLTELRERESARIEQWESFREGLETVATVTTIEFGYFTVSLEADRAYVALVTDESPKVLDRYAALFRFEGDADHYIQLGPYSRIKPGAGPAPE